MNASAVLGSKTTRKAGIRPSAIDANLMFGGGYGARLEGVNVLTKAPVAIADQSNTEVLDVSADKQ